MAAACRISLSQPSLPLHRRHSPQAPPRLATVRCASEGAQVAVGPPRSRVSDPSPVFTSLKSFAPATVANLGPGFDFLGCAVDGVGDHVTASVDASVRPGSVAISSITGGPGAAKLNRNPLWNCAGIAAIEVMRSLAVRSVGVSLQLHKGLPLGSGLGSSAASAAAAAVAVNELFGGHLSPSELVLACLVSEAKVSGYHADNVGPAIMGGFVLIRSYDPLEILRLEFPAERDLYFVLASPDFEAPTKKMRAALPADVRMKDHIFNSSQAAALVAAVLQGDVRVLGAALSSDVIAVVVFPFTACCSLRLRSTFFPTVMEASQVVGGAEECSSSESGWTMYLASPMHDDEGAHDEAEGGGDHNNDDDDGENLLDNDSNDDDGGHRSGDEEEDGDSLASDASSGPPHRDVSRKNGGAARGDNVSKMVVGGDELEDDRVEVGIKKKHAAGFSWKKGHEVAAGKKGDDL